jgi:23S rRNA (cytosine1962-C5)-methyltransferase
VVEDALKYAKRLVQRGEQFEVIIMDPPAFGRGPKGEVWKIEEKLAELVAVLPQLLSAEAKLVILNGYAAGYSARTFGELLHDALPQGEVTYGEIGIQQKDSGRILTTSIYGTWQSR